MQPPMAYLIVRWLAVLAALSIAYLYFNYAVFLTWLAPTLVDYEHVDAWTYEAYLSFGRSLALVFTALLLGINIRPGWPHLRSKWNLFLVGAVLASLLVPPGWRFLAIDSCLDAGGRWIYEYERCSSAV